MTSTAIKPIEGIGELTKEIKCTSLEIFGHLCLSNYISWEISDAATGYIKYTVDFVNNDLSH